MSRTAAVRAFGSRASTAQQARQASSPAASRLGATPPWAIGDAGAIQECPYKSRTRLIEELRGGQEILFARLTLADDEDRVVRYPGEDQRIRHLEDGGAVDDHEVVPRSGFVEDLRHALGTE